MSDKWINWIAIPIILFIVFLTAECSAIKITNTEKRVAETQGQNKTLTEENSALKSQIDDLNRLTGAQENQIAVLKNQMEDLQKQLQTSPETKKAAAANVRLAENTPLDRTVIIGEREIILAKILIAAGSRNLLLNTMTAQSYGTATNADLTSLSLYLGDTRISSAKIDPRTEKAIFDNIGLVIPSHVNVILTIKGNLSEKAVNGRTIQVGIDAHNNVGGNDVFDGTFPIKGALMTIAAN